MWVLNAFPSVELSQWFRCERLLPHALACAASELLPEGASTQPHPGQPAAASGPAPSREAARRNWRRPALVRRWSFSRRSAGFPEFVATHLAAVAQDHQNGVFSAETDVVERIGGQAPQSLPEFVRANRARFTRELQEVS